MLSHYHLSLAITATVTQLRAVPTFEQSGLVEPVNVTIIYVFAELAINK